MADSLVIATATSRPHVLALAEHVTTALKSAGASILGVEGTDSAEWVLIDTGDIIVHIFQEDARELYRLERLWSHTFDTDTDELGEELDLTANL